MYAQTINVNATEKIIKMFKDLCSPVRLKIQMYFF